MMGYRLAAVAVLMAALAAPAAAQGRGWDPAGLQLTRTELRELLQRYEETSASGAYSSALREQARTEASLIRQRLEEGDIRVGDRVMLVVEGHTQLSDTFNVVAGRRIVLPDLGDIPLTGVLRSELQGYLTQQVARFIRDPVVQARSLIRLEIMGAVGRPGFYTIPSDFLISDALMMAGGPSSAADVEKLRIQRGPTVIWDGTRLREAVIEGRTLDQLSVRAGDGIHVPQQRSRFDSFRTGLAIVSGITSIVLLATRLGVL
jgi:protein involved in polysaccharide export with SLBB domain